MDKFKKESISGIQWLIDSPKYVLIISHGMAEHAERYNDFANYLNQHSCAVFAINHMGHGESIEKEELGHWPKNGFNICVNNLFALTQHAKQVYPNVPIILFGHSMGSFIAQEYIKCFSDSIDGVILSGSSKAGLLHKSGNLLANVLFACGDNHKKNNFLNKLSFGSFNKSFKPNRSNFDWLSSDNQQVDKYIEDPLCGFVCTTGFFKGFFKGLSKLNKKIDNIDKNLPIYIMSGSKDPVGSFGKGVINLYNMYVKNDMTNVNIKLYENGRHEMLNEVNQMEVYMDIMSWIKKI